MANNLPVPETKIEYYLNAIAGGATPSPGSKAIEEFELHATLEINQETFEITGNFDKTPPEITAALQEGKIISCVFDSAFGVAKCYATSITYDGSNFPNVHFESIFIVPGGGGYIKLYVATSNIDETTVLVDGYSPILAWPPQMGGDQ